MPALFTKIAELPKELRLEIFEAAIENEKDFQQPMLRTKIRSELRFIDEAMPIYHKQNFKLTKDNAVLFYRSVPRNVFMEVVRHITIEWEGNLCSLMGMMLTRNHL